MLQKQAGHNPMGHVILAPGVSPVRPRIALAQSFRKNLGKKDPLRQTVFPEK